MGSKLCSDAVGHHWYPYDFYVSYHDRLVAPEVAEPESCMDAARSAAITALRVAHRRHVTEKEFVLYKAMQKCFAPRRFPLWILYEVLALSFESPAIIEQLQLWEEVAGWETQVEAQNLEADGREAEVLSEETAADVQRSGSSSFCSVSNGGKYIYAFVVIDR